MPTYEKQECREMRIDIRLDGTVIDLEGDAPLAPQAAKAIATRGYVGKADLNAKFVVVTYDPEGAGGRGRQTAHCDDLWMDTLEGDKKRIYLPTNIFDALPKNLTAPDKSDYGDRVL